MKNMKKLTCQILAACALTTGMMLVNGGLAFAETKEASGNTEELTPDPDPSTTYDNDNPVFSGRVLLIADASGNVGTANNNTLTIKGSTKTFTQTVLAGGNVEIKYTGTGTAAGNSLTIEDGVFMGALHGGHVEIKGASSANTATANGNTLNITTGTFHGDIAGGYVDTKGGTAQANENTLQIDGGTFHSYNNVHISGGWARSIEGSSCVAQANGNKVEISNITTNVRFSPAVKGSDGEYSGDGFLNRSIYGGYATSYTGGTATANNNSLTISDSNIVIMPHATITSPEPGKTTPDKGYSEGIVYAGCAINGTTNVANNNTLTINGGTIYGYSKDTLKAEFSEYSDYFDNPDYEIGMDKDTDIGGGFANETAAGNKVIIHSGTIGGTGTEINVYGGKARTLAKGNEVIIAQEEGKTVTITGNVSGGYGEGDNPTIEGNRVVFTAGTVNGMVSGGSGMGTIKGNEVLINGNVKGTIYGGLGADGMHFTTVDGNRVVITDGATVTGDVHGGYADDDYATVAKNNAVIIADGTVKGNVFGGGVYWGSYMDGDAQNVVNNAVILGAADGEGKATVEGNVFINWEYSASGTVKKALSGGNLNVYNVGNKVTENVNAPGANINFYIKAGEDDTSTPRLTAATTHLDNANVKVNVKQLGTIAENTDYNLFGGAIDGTPASATITDEFIDSRTTLDIGTGKVTLNHANDRANENSKSPSETQIVGVALVNGVMDMMANQGINEAAKAVGNNDGGRSMVPFATVGGSKLRQHSGSYVDMNTWNVGIGFAKEVTNRHGKLMFGPVVEYGKGSYDSYLDNGVHGSGDSSFWGVGAMMKQENKDGLYYEGSFRVGRLKNEYESQLAGGANYENSATFYALHAGVGKVVKLNEDDTMDYYGKFFYTRQGSSSATLTSGHIYDFDAINSFRTRLGFRYTHKVSANQDLYAGLAWQHEFGSKAGATFHSGPYSFSAPAPSVKGETGILELGMKVRPSNGKFESNFGFLGSFGKQRGFGFNAQFQWNF